MKRKKPTGKGQTMAMGRDHAPIVTERRIEGTKDEIEREIVRRALTSLAAQKLDPYQITGEATQNSESDFDFTVQTKNGPEPLELTEFAPLHLVGGQYEDMPNVYDVETVARVMIDTIERKASNYGDTGNTSLHLLVYSTDRRTTLSSPVLNFVAMHFATTTPKFRSIVYMGLGREDSSPIYCLFPASPELLVDPRSHANQRILHITADLSLAEPNKDGTAVFIPIGKLIAEQQKRKKRD